MKVPVYISVTAHRVLHISNENNLDASLILVNRQHFRGGHDLYIKMYNCIVHDYPQSPVQSHQPSPSRSIKRKFLCDDDAYTGAFCSNKVDPSCLQPFSAQRTQYTLAGSEAPAEFYPIPNDVDQAVLASMGVGESKQRNIPLHIFGKRPQHATPRLLEPPMNAEHMTDSNFMEEDLNKPAYSLHGPQCRSIPRLSVRDTGHVGSELWAYCPDCHAFGKVQDV